MWRNPLGNPLDPNQRDPEAMAFRHCVHLHRPGDPWDIYQCRWVHCKSFEVHD